MTTLETRDDPEERRAPASSTKTPGVVVLFAEGAPTFRVHDARKPVVVGRVVKRGIVVVDDRVSREHALVSEEQGRWTVRDLGSRNGTHVDGERVDEEMEGPAGMIVRVGGTLLLLVDDVTPLRRAHRLDDPTFVRGPAMQAALDAIAQAAEHDRTLLVRGESGTGKEHAARTYHLAGSAPKGPFVPVNCSAIQKTVAERLIFGAKKGAYSGSTTDAHGYVQAADGGVLFLDEIGELDLDVQAKLLRFLETKEAIPVGASAPKQVDVRVCAATNRDLRAWSAEDRFRADLYYRLAQHEVVLPPLRARKEEIPWLVALELGAEAASARFVEACLLRRWPGNVRELRSAAARAHKAARAAGEEVVGAEFLAKDAGVAFASADASFDDERERSSGPKPPLDHPLRDALVEAMKTHEGNVAAVARALGMHRTQVYRWLKKLGLDHE
ncbi:MAG: sigma 54-interacting transcriptional regulator [Polyangiales bacterium]